MGLRCDGKIDFFVVVENVCGAIVTLFVFLDWKGLCSMHPLASQLRPSHKDS